MKLLRLLKLKKEEFRNSKRIEKDDNNIQESIKRLVNRKLRIKQLIKKFLEKIFENMKFKNTI